MDLSVQHAHPDAANREIILAECLRLRAKGYSYREIAEETGLTSKSTACLYVREALDEIREQNSESAMQLRQLELERLDMRDRKLWDGDAALTPDVNNSLLRNSERRARLVGLDAPVDARFGGIPGATAIPVAHGFDTSKYTVEELEQLDTLLARQTAPSPELGPIT